MIIENIIKSCDEAHKQVVAMFVRETGKQNISMQGKPEYSSLFGG